MEVKPGWHRMRSGEIVYIHGKAKTYDGWVGECNDGDVVIWESDGSYRTAKCKDEYDLIEPLPDCTGYDYVPETKYVPWDYESCPVGSQLKDKHSPPSRFLITGADSERLFINGHPWSYKTAFDTWTQLDGKPAGKVQS